MTTQKMQRKKLPPQRNASGRLYTPTGRPPGRPRAIESAEVFDARVDEYVLGQYDRGMPLTWAGLALHIGFVTVQTMLDYEQRPEFAGSVKRARTLMQEFLEGRLSGPNSSGAMFALSQRWMGWENSRYLRQEAVPPASADGIDWSKVPDATLKQLLSLLQSLPKDRPSAALPANVTPIRR
jgi:hypothetical protein